MGLGSIRWVGLDLIGSRTNGRKAACIELDPKYVDVIIRRFQNATGAPAVHSVWEQTFDDLASEKEAQYV